MQYLTGALHHAEGQGRIALGTDDYLLQTLLGECECLLTLSQIHKLI